VVLHKDLANLCDFALASGAEIPALLGEIQSGGMAAFSPLTLNVETVVAKQKMQIAEECK
jgi:hypothetical protein